MEVKKYSTKRLAGCCCPSPLSHLSAGRFLHPNDLVTVEQAEGVESGLDLDVERK
jgi:hypothetical protein